MAQARRAGWRGVREEPASYVPQSFTGSNLADLGRKRCAPAAAVVVAGNFAGGVTPLLVEAMGKDCGVPMARPQGHSRAPPPSSESQ